MDKNNTKLICEKLMILLCGYRHMTSSIRNNIEKLGFQVETGKTHCKIYYGVTEGIPMFWGVQLRIIVQVLT